MKRLHPVAGGCSIRLQDQTFLVLFATRHSKNALADTST